MADAKQKQKQAAEPEPQRMPDGVFKTVPMGFDKKEVNLYIRKLIEKMRVEAEERLVKELAAVKPAPGSGGNSNTEELNNRIASLTASYNEANDRAASYETRATNLQVNLDRVLNELDKLKASGGAAAGIDVSAIKKDAEREAERIVNAAKSQADAIIAEAKIKSESFVSSDTKTVAVADPAAFNEILSILGGGKKQLTDSYSALSALFDSAIAAAEKGASAPPVAIPEKQITPPKQITPVEPVIPKPAPSAPTKPAEIEIAPPKKAISDSAFNEFSALSFDGGSDTDSSVSDTFDGFAGFEMDTGGDDDELSAFADFSIDSEPADFPEHAAPKKPAPPARPAPAPAPAPVIDDAFSEFSEFALTLEPDTDDSAGTPLIQKSNRGEYSDEFQDLMLTSAEKPGKGKNLTEADVAVNTRERGSDLDDSILDMMISPSSGSLTISKSDDDDGYSISLSDLSMPDPVPGTINPAGRITTPKPQVKIPPSPSESVWNFDVDESDDDDDMSTDADILL